MTEPERTPELVEKSKTWTHPDTGVEVEIPAGATIVRNGDVVETMVGPMRVEADAPDGEILHWRHPPIVPEGELHADQVEGHEPTFDRGATRRRVLMFVTDEVDLTDSDANASRYLVDRAYFGPRNTTKSIAFAMARDDWSPSVPRDLARAEEIVQTALDQLADAGLVKKGSGDRYELTAVGRVELAN